MKAKYVYNFTLANWLIREKHLIPVGAGIGAKGDYFIQFAFTEGLEIALSEWHTYFKNK